MSKRMDFTVAIPTYNGEQRVPAVLERLRRQSNSNNIAWEVLIVDNGSTDDTAAVVQSFQASWPAAVPLRYCFEPRQGIAFARQHAVEEARGDFVGFLDDDNIPAGDWVAEAYAFGVKQRRAGAYGGQVHPHFEGEPPPNIERLLSFFAIAEHGPQPRCYNPHVVDLPPGAGLVVRKEAWIQSVPSRLIRQERGGNDFEISMHLHSAGWEIWYNPTMHLDHHIAQARLEKNALLTLMRTCGLCLCQIRCIGLSRRQKLLMMTKVILGNAYRLVRHLMIYRTSFQRDMVAACELEFLLCCIVSPVYLLRQARRERTQSKGKVLSPAASLGAGSVKDRL